MNWAKNNINALEKGEDMLSILGILIFPAIIYFFILMYLTGLPIEPIYFGIIPTWMFWSILLWLGYYVIFVFWALRMNKFFKAQEKKEAKSNV